MLPGIARKQPCSVERRVVRGRCAHPKFLKRSRGENTRAAEISRLGQPSPAGGASSAGRNLRGRCSRIGTRNRRAPPPSRHPYCRLQRSRRTTRTRAPARHGHPERFALAPHHPHVARAGQGAHATAAAPRAVDGAPAQGSELSCLQDSAGQVPGEMPAHAATFADRPLDPVHSSRSTVSCPHISKLSVHASAEKSSAVTASRGAGRHGSRVIGLFYYINWYNI